MTQFKYQLDKTSKKFKCPKCGEKNCFVRYINNESNNYADSEFGRCDREQKCAHFHKPTNTKSYEPKYHINKVKLIVSTIKYEILNQTIQSFDNNPLVQYLFKKYEKNEVEQIIKKYNIGTANMYNGATVFWQMDDTGKIRTGKIMSYNTETGKSIKKSDAKSKINHWMNIIFFKKLNFKQTFDLSSALTKKKLKLEDCGVL